MKFKNKISTHTSVSRDTSKSTGRHRQAPFKQFKLGDADKSR